jgi:hypothetical protein
MALVFDGSSQGLYVDKSIASAYPLTFAGWLYPDQSADYQAIISIGDSVNSYSEQCFIGTDNASAAICRIADDSANDENAQTSNSFTQYAWNHIVGVFAAAADRTVILNGDIANKGTDLSGSVNFPTMNRTAVGTQYANGGWHHRVDGRLAEVAAWRAALTDFEAQLLAMGLSPLLIRPSALIFYLPMTDETVVDLIGGLKMHRTNDPTMAAHPEGIVYPPSQKLTVIPNLPTRLYA